MGRNGNVTAVGGAIVLVALLAWVFGSAAWEWAWPILAGWMG